MDSRNSHLDTTFTFFTSTLWLFNFASLKVGLHTSLYGEIGLSFPVCGLYGKGLARLACRSNFFFGVGVGVAGIFAGKNL